VGLPSLLYYLLLSPCLHRDYPYSTVSVFLYDGGADGHANHRSTSGGPTLPCLHDILLSRFLCNQPLAFVGCVFLSVFLCHFLPLNQTKPTRIVPTTKPQAVMMKLTGVGLPRKPR